jgi:hypothetical protein
MPRVRRGLRSTLLGAAILLAAAPAAAQAQQIPIPIPGGNLPTPPPITAPIFGPFRSVLAQGEGQSVTASDLAANQANGTVPDTFTSQQPLYVGIMPKARTLVPGELDTYYKRTDFGQMPGDVLSYSEPKPGARIFRDRAYGMAHIFGDTRYNLMFATGYATAQERLFLMDALRRTAKGTLAGLTGPSAARGDADQLTDQDFSDAELTEPDAGRVPGARHHAAEVDRLRHGRRGHAARYPVHRLERQRGGERAAPGGVQEALRREDLAQALPRLPRGPGPGGAHRRTQALPE